MVGTKLGNVLLQTSQCLGTQVCFMTNFRFQFEIKYQAHFLQAERLPSKYISFPSEIKGHLLKVLLPIFVGRFIQMYDRVTPCRLDHR
jgi:hypothetical protein